jgi:hypothetical protein
MPETVTMQSWLDVGFGKDVRHALNAATAVMSYSNGLVLVKNCESVTNTYNQAWKKQSAAGDYANAMNS